MSSSDVRSIESLRRLREVLASLSGDWTEVLQQIRYTVRRIEEHFGSQWPAYWRRETTQAEASLSEAMDNLSRMQSTGSGASHPATEAEQRVHAARRRLAQCQAKQTLAKRAALATEKACQSLAGPLAEVSLHAEVNLPKAAAELATLIDHLDRYAAIESPRSTGPERPNVIGGVVDHTELNRASPEAES